MSAGIKYNSQTLSFDDHLPDHQQALVQGDRREIKHSRKDRLHRRDDQTSMDDELT
jgi:hypothetical protein